MKAKALSKLKKPLIGMVLYILPITIGVNFYMTMNIKMEKNEDFFMEKLFDLGYYKDKGNPYEAAINLDFHPTNYLSLPITSKRKNAINNQTFSLDNNGYRTNPYLIKDGKKRKCLLFLGSSAGFGIGTSSNWKTIPSLLNQKLGKEYSLYNLAVPTWNSRQELISVIDFLKRKEVSNCKSLDTISLTGTADIISLKNNINSELFKDEESRLDLISANENYMIMSANLKSGLKASSSIKFNAKMILNQVFESLFGQIYHNISKIFKPNNDNDQLAHYEFGLNQINSFFINHQILNDLIYSLGGNHIMVLQPSLNNFEAKKSVWEFANTIITKKLSNNFCLNILDLRYSLIKEQPKYKIGSKLVPLSLKDAIISKRLDEQTLVSHLFFDNNHYTDFGTAHITELISNAYLSNSPMQSCLKRYG